MATRIGYVKYGFTGTRQGMTEAQKRAFRELIALTPQEFHHGACVGADADAVAIVREVCPECVIHARPGRSARGGDNEYRSQEAVKCSQVVHPELTHFERNRQIVMHGYTLIAAPWQSSDRGEPPEATGGGTWYTIRYALKGGYDVFVLWADGLVDLRNRRAR